MKGVDIPCASQASTAIRLAMEEPSSSSSACSSSVVHLGKAIDRFNPMIRDERRTTAKSLHPPAPNPNPTPKKPPAPPPKGKDRVTGGGEQGKRKGKESGRGGVRKGWGCTLPGDFISPPTSSRYLLGDNKALLNVLSDFDPLLKSVPVEPISSDVVKREDYSPSDSKPSLLLPPPPPRYTSDQVVVLKVSLHCRACERKMRKHISRMEGVTSFNIDFAAKMVTVVGDVTPTAVLASISKVKNAQLLAPAVSPSPPQCGLGLPGNRETPPDCRVK